MISQVSVRWNFSRL